MYFLSQISSQFEKNIFHYAGDGPGGGGGTTTLDDMAAPGVDVPVADASLQEKFSGPMDNSDILQELKERLDSLKAAESIVGPEAEVLLRFCHKVKDGEIEGLDVSDEDYKRLCGIAIRKVEEYRTLTGEAGQINEKVRVELARLGGQVQREIDKPEENEVLSEEDEKLQEDLTQLEIRRDSYMGVLREKKQKADKNPETSRKTELLFTETQELGETEITGTMQEKLTEIQAVNEGLKDYHEKIDQSMLADEIIYDYSLLEINHTEESVEKLKELLPGIIAEARESFFTGILDREDTGKDLSDYIDQDIIIALARRHEDEEYSYNITDIMHRFDAIELDESGDIQEVGTSLSVAKIQYEMLARDLKIIARDQEIIEGETTFGEKRMEITHEVYKELLENQEVEDALKDGNENIPTFEELEMDHIRILRNLSDDAVDFRKLFLINLNGTNFEGTSLSEGQSYVVNFGYNENFPDKMDFSFIDTSGKDIKIDGRLASFDAEGRNGAGYYTEDGFPAMLQDGSKVEIVSIRDTSDEEAEAEVSSAIDERLDELGASDTQRRAFNESTIYHPDANFEGKTLPGGVIGAVLAMLLNFFDGRNFQYNAEKGIWEDMPEGSNATPVTNGEIMSSYVGGIELGSLSAEFESASQGPYAYNPDDNGHGPSYGTYQMNTDVGVYKSFIAKHGITPGKDGWMASIEKYGVEEFKRMEHEHIKQNNYDPMMNRITVANKQDFSMAMKNVIWSIGVQHGPGHRGLLSVINNSGVKPGDKDSEASLIDALYNKRGEVYPAGIANRYNRERALAHSMLDTVFSQNIYEGDLGLDNLPEIRQRIVGRAIAAYERRDTLQSDTSCPDHCTGWVQKIFKQEGLQLHNISPLFNADMYEVPSTGRGDTGFRFNNYAPPSIIAQIRPGDHLAVDHNKGHGFNRGRTHSVIALEAPRDGLVKTVSYPGGGGKPYIAVYDLYGEGRANTKQGKVWRIHSPA